jgi:protein involved in polysaccharide export with SLBB domain
LAGVLRFELNDHITRAVNKEYSGVQLRTSHMMSLSITGEVTEPGYRAVSQDTPLRDAVLPQGAMTSQADVNKIVIRRDGTVIYGSDTTRAAMQSGKTIEDLGLVHGDEIEVGMKRQTNWYNIVQIASGGLGLILGIYSLVR